MIIFFQYFGAEINTLEQVTDEIILIRLQKDLADDLDDLSADQVMKIVCSNGHTKMSEPDAAFRIRNLLHSYHNFLVQRHWESIIENCPKVAVEHICSLLEPEVFKTRVQSHLTLTKKHLKKHWQSFCNYLVTEAVNFDKYYPKNSTSTKSKEPFDKAVDLKASKPPTGSSKEILSASKAKGIYNVFNQKVRNTNSKQMQSIKKDLTNLENKFDEPHRNITTAKKEGNNFKTSKNETSKKLSLLSKEPHHNIPPGRLKGRLADQIDVVTNGEYGSDHAALSEDHLQLCHDLGIFVETLNLQTPIEVSLAMTENSKSIGEANF